MKASQLKELCNKTPGFQGVSKKSKAEIIAELTHKLPEANRAPKRKFADADLSAAKEALFYPVGKNSSIVDFYNDHYGFLDRIDKDFYKIYQTTNNHTWKKTFGWAMTMFFV